MATKQKASSPSAHSEWSTSGWSGRGTLASLVGDNYLYEIEVDAADMEAIDPGNTFIALKVTEDSNDPIVDGDDTRKWLWTFNAQEFERVWG